jgi:hypothetical protein
MSDRAKAAQKGGGELDNVGRTRTMTRFASRTWHRVGIIMAMGVVAACSGGDDNPTGGTGATGGAGGSAGSGAGGKGGATTAGAAGSGGGTSGSGGSAGKSDAGTGGTSGKGGSAGSGGSAGAGAAAGTAGAGGSKDGGPGTGGSGGSTDAGTPDASQDTSMPPVDASGDTVGGNLTVVTVDPVARGIQASGSAPITITFDRPVNRTSVTNKSLWAYGRWGGPVRPAMYTFSNSDKTVAFAPARNWPAGDRVTVVLSHDLAGADGTKLRSQGYSYQYTTAAKAANQMYTEVQRLTSRTNTSTTTRTYGGSVADLNNDGFLDLMTINEDSADMRIFLNKGATGTATSQYNAFVQPPTKVGNRASPSETTDFNGDGIVDIVVANLNDDTLSILFGNNNGTFTTSQTPAVGGQPRGVAVIDVDGDGDIDIVNTNADGDNMSLLKNDGTGKFPTSQTGPDGGPGIIFFDSAFGNGTASQEFGLMSGDMNEDGILDIVIGARGIMGANRATVVNLGTGNGMFTFGSLQAPMTSGWQLSVGDMNGDGHEDVATADADLSTTLSLNTVTILLGDGKGKVTPQQTYSGTLNRPFAIDMGDIDGDKDLDLVVSNFSGNWQVLLNDGTSKVTAGQNWAPAQSASCALLIDIDNDQDLDLVVVDEEEDQVVVLRQSP